ncbi:hypothetical protein VTL71DRAFT_14617 [Oculimacula yallundae]|uniref:Uncharacterized protein n=1 Tax=Oculimacula yallundae TaxID=86028 RepID=A0ABR4CL11_9HELO
MAFTARKARFS